MSVSELGFLLQNRSCISAICGKKWECMGWVCMYMYRLVCVCALSCMCVNAYMYVNQFAIEMTTFIKWFQAKTRWFMTVVPNWGPRIPRVPRRAFGGPLEPAEAYNLQRWFQTLGSFLLQSYKPRQRKFMLSNFW